jgi:hypothetical protein
MSFEDDQDALVESTREIFRLEAIVTAADKLADAVEAFGKGKLELHQLRQEFEFYEAARGRGGVD